MFKNSYFNNIKIIFERCENSDFNIIDYFFKLIKMSF